MGNPTQAIFTPPAANTDDSPISNGEIADYLLEVGPALTAAQIAAGQAQAFPIVFKDLDVAPSATDGTISVPLESLGILAPGDYVGRVVAETGAGVDSDPSPVGAFTIAPVIVKPNPPGAPTFA